MAQRVLVVGAGVGGLAAAVELAGEGFDVLLLERASTPGGKMREIEVGGARIDAGPTVFTMRWVFDELFDAAGADFGARVRLHRAERLARHAWPDGGRLDLFSEIERNVEAIADFAGPADAINYRAFAARAETIYRILRDPFIRDSRPSLPTLTRRIGRARDLIAISPFVSLWRALANHFRDPRLRQLFGRYATYCGSSPFLAPATLMLVAHVEREGVYLIEGGMRRLADALCDLARERGAELQFNRPVARILTTNGRAAGVVTEDGERLFADAVIFNGDAGALGQGLLGEAVRRAPPPPGAPSLSALTFALQATPQGFPLLRHNVFFGSDYRAEFEAIFARHRLPEAPTVYVCAQDRDAAASTTGGAERLFLLVNAPAHHERTPLSEGDLKRCEAATYHHLQRCGLALDPRASVRTTPADFAALFPGSRGALYGPASHGWRASFARSGAATRIPGLYLAGGSVHPGPGVPMAALSGRQAAKRVMADLASTRRPVPAAMPGGTSTRSATTVGSG